MDCMDFMDCRDFMDNGRGEDVLAWVQRAGIIGAMEKAGLIRKHAGYRKLKSFQSAQLC